LQNLKEGEFVVTLDTAPSGKEHAQYKTAGARQAGVRQLACMQNTQNMLMHHLHPEQMAPTSIGTQTQHAAGHPEAKQAHPLAPKQNIVIHHKHADMHVTEGMAHKWTCWSSANKGIHGEEEVPEVGRF
jgi:hypothetical protein